MYYSKQEMDSEKVIIKGTRGIEFRDFIQSLLMRSKLSKKNIDFLTNSKNIGFYETAFTHRNVDINNNYEFYELMGDVTCNKIIVWYIKERFPFLNNMDGVKVIARLRINLVSKKTFSKWASRLGFEQFISYDEETKAKQNMSVLEDCFEAFFGITELLINDHFKTGGYHFAFQMLSSIIDEENISLLYKDLYDPITRLKETFDYFNAIEMKSENPKLWGTIKFDTRRMENSTQVKLIQKIGLREDILLRKEEAQPLDEIKYALCEQYLNILKQKGYEKPLPKYYQEIEVKRKKFEVI
jgi:dsRNA-specific ribonuclease